VPNDTDTTWSLTNTGGELTVHTGVAGRAARMGHRLTLLMESWQVSVAWSAGKPVAGQLVVDVDSLQVQRGEGGVTPLTGAEKAVARNNALKSLDAKRFPQIEFHADSITESGTGYLLAGPLTIHGVTKPVDVALALAVNGDQWQLSCQADIRQSDFGIKPFTMMMGTMKVDDVVRVAFGARRTAPVGIR
jgi:polyisoprenoid-binding protein YceI